METASRSTLDILFSYSAQCKRANLSSLSRSLGMLVKVPHGDQFCDRAALLTEERVEGVAA